MFSWFKKNALIYRTYGGKPYWLNMVIIPDCYVYMNKNSCFIASFDTMEIKGKSLHIDHFAMISSLKGSGKAEAVLRGFAKIIAQETPDIIQITFDLHRSAEGSNIARLAAARSELLVKIGARDVSQRMSQTGNICVSAVWEKAHWEK